VVEQVVDRALGQAAAEHDHVARVDDDVLALGISGKVFISPAAHRLHHIRDEELMGSNYGNMLTLWDKVFGTYVDPAPFVNCETGIAEGTRDALGELARPFEARYWRKPEAEPAEQPTG
jgi:sterol desaturase/sphingolipid hydroxylase (fatty acid hydroxylase superfamily)